MHQSDHPFTMFFDRFSLIIKSLDHYTRFIFLLQGSKSFGRNQRLILLDHDTGDFLRGFKYETFREGFKFTFKLFNRTMRFSAAACFQLSKITPLFNDTAFFISNFNKRQQILIDPVKAEIFLRDLFASQLECQETKNMFL